jgi:hypothetical protein
MDEISTFIKYEFDGLVLLVKAPFQFAAMIGRAINAIINFSEERASRKAYRTESKERLQNAKNKQEARKNYEKILKDGNSDGEVSFKNIGLMSEGTPQVLQIPEQFKNEIFAELKEKGIPYSQMIDFTPEDMNQPVAVTFQAAQAATTIINKYKDKYKYELDSEAVQCTKQIAELKERKNTLYIEMGSPEPGTSEYKAWEDRCVPIDIEVENLSQRHDEIVSFNKFNDSGATVMSFEEYIKSGNASFRDNPEKDAHEAAMGIPQGKPFQAQEILQPIRSKVSIPTSCLSFYLPEHGAIITRQFECDKNGVWFSTYSLKTQDGEIYSVSDKGITKDEWNNNPRFLKELLGKAGILANTECKIFISEEQLQAYLKQQNEAENASPREEEIVRRKIANGQPVFSSEAARAAVQDYISEASKIRNMAYQDKDSVVMEVDVRQVLDRGDGLLTIFLNESESINVMDVKVLERDELTGRFKIEIPPSAEPTYFNKNNYSFKNNENGTIEQDYRGVHLSSEKLSQIINRSNYQKNDNQYDKGGQGYNAGMNGQGFNSYGDNRNKR